MQVKVSPAATRVPVAQGNRTKAGADISRLRGGPGPRGSLASAGGHHASLARRSRRGPGRWHPVIHYHGTPITPARVLSELGGRCFCVSYAAPANLARCHEIGQSVMLDNGAYSIWRRVARRTPLPGRLRAAGRGEWSGYHEWAEPWLEYPTTWAVIPDVIGGGEEENDALLRRWSERGLPRGAPVWHMHESIERLRRLAGTHERVCIGSSGEFSQVGGERWRRRMDFAMSAICGSGPVPVWLHMLRGMALGGSEYPFASVDSTDVARNHARERRRGRSAAAMAARWDRRQNPARWNGREQLVL